MLEIRRKVDRMAASLLELEIWVLGKELSVWHNDSGGAKISLAASLSQAVGCRDNALEVKRSVLSRVSCVVRWTSDVHELTIGLFVAGLRTYHYLPSRPSYISSFSDL
jgi:hypothetical protein